MAQFLVLCALMVVAFVQLVQGQLVPLPTIPPVTIPPITLPPITIPPVGVVVPTVTVCPAGYFSNLLSCYPCPAGSTSTAGVTCTVCPTGFYAPGPGSASCFACAKGSKSAPAGDSCITGTCGKSSDGKSSDGKGKRSLREEVEEEAEAESMFSF